MWSLAVTRQIGDQIRKLRGAISNLEEKVVLGMQTLTSTRKYSNRINFAEISYQMVLGRNN